jgi:hypothetical protein
MKFQRFASVASVFPALLVFATWSAGAETFLVTNPDDSGSGSLRQAILSAAAAEAGEHRIEFQIPGLSSFLIRPTSQLPDLRGPLVLDATTQQGYSGRPLIELRGDRAGAADGLRLSGGFCTARGLVINRFQRAGIRLLGGTNTVQGNFIGTDSTGKFSMGNGEAGVDLFLGGGHNLIGGLTSFERNVISGNRWGLYVFAPENVVQGNYIGLDVDGVSALGNATGISLVRSSRNQIGGLLPGEGNVISGNSGNGLELLGGASDGASFNVIAGNLIGLDAAGGAAVANGLNGLLLGANAATNVIGGLNGEGANVISGNLGSGVVFQDAKPGNRLSGNLIGLERSGTNPVSNLEYGVRLSARAQTLGGPEAGAGNVIAFNGRAGVFVESGTNNLLQANRVFSNGGLGIALGPNGVTFNDDGDLDEGPNGLQNYPELQGSRLVDGLLTLQASLLSRPSRSYTLEFFASPDCDPSGAGEGFLHLGRTNLTTGAGGSVTFSITLSNNSILPGWRVTATAADSDGNSSEFSPCLPVTSMLPIFVLQPLSQAVVSGGNVTFSAEIAGEPAPFAYELRRGGVSLATNLSSERMVFFTLTNVAPSQAGAYQIVVRNSTSMLGVSSATAILSVLVDTDHDGLPDAWEVAFGLGTNNAADATRDADADGQTNLQEYNSGTNPNDPASRLRLVANRLADALVLRFDAVSNRTYTIQSRNDGLTGSWSNYLHWVARPSSGLVSFTNALGFGPQFYRLLTPAQP